MQPWQRRYINTEFVLKKRELEREKHGKVEMEVIWDSIFERGRGNETNTEEKNMYLSSQRGLYTQPGKGERERGTKENFLWSFPSILFELHTAAKIVEITLQSPCSKVAVDSQKNWLLVLQGLGLGREKHP